MTINYQPAVIPTNLTLPAVPKEAQEWLSEYLRALHRALQEQNVRIATALQLLNQTRLYVGTLADRPEPASSGIVYVVTDDSTVYYDAGSWVQVAGASGEETVDTDTAAGFSSYTLAELLTLDLATTTVLAAEGA